MIGFISLPLRQQFPFRMESQSPSLCCLLIQLMDRAWASMVMHWLLFASRNKCDLTGLYLLISWNGSRLPMKSVGGNQGGLLSQKGIFWNAPLAVLVLKKLSNASRALGCPFQFCLNHSIGCDKKRANNIWCQTKAFGKISHNFGGRGREAADGKLPDMYTTWQGFQPPMNIQNHFLFNAGLPPQNFTLYYSLL